MPVLEFQSRAGMTAAKPEIIMDEIPKFIKKECISTLSLKPSESISKDKIETIILKLLMKGIGLWKVDSPPGLCVEYALTQSINEELEFIKQYQNEIYHRLEPNKKYFPLSFSQQMMCIQIELYQNTTYQLTLPFYVNEDIQEERFQKAIETVVSRHAILRTVFPKLQHNWIQVVLPSISPEIKFIPFEENREKQDKINQFILNEKTHRFNIARGPLFRITVLKLEKSRYLLILNIHHAIFDGISLPIFTQDVMNVYKSITLPALQAQYTDFVLEQKGLRDSLRKKEIEFWQNQLEDCPLQCQIPSDFPNGPFEQRRWNEKNEIVTFSISTKDFDQFLQFCQSIHVSFSTFILTGIYILLHQFSHDTDIIIGTILNQRNRVQYENVIGDFNNLVPLRLLFPDEITGIELLKKVQTVFFDAFSHQKIPFNELVEHIKTKRNIHNLPFYNIFFDSLNLDAFQRNFKNDQVEIIPHDVLQIRATPLMDLFFLLVQHSNQASLHCLFNPKLLKTETVSDLLKQLHAILMILCTKPDSKIDAKVIKKPAIFCIPGADGLVEVFSRIRAGIPSYRFLALKYQGTESSLTQPLKSVSEIASNFISLMTSIHPSSDSLLLALSTGGFVALEILHQLQAQNLKYISKIILIDTPRRPKKSFSLMKYQGKEDILLLLLNYAIKVFPTETVNSAPEFESDFQQMTLVQKEQFIYDWIKKHTLLPLPPFEGFDRLVDFIETNIKAVINYKPQPYEGQIEVFYIASSEASTFVSGQKPMTLEDKKSYWSRLFPKAQIKFFIVPNSDHFSMIWGENVNIIRQLLSDILNESI